VYFLTSSSHTLGAEVISMIERRPVLVIVGGAAASGKTTLARRIADERKLPLLARDTIKETLMDTLGSPDRARSRELGAASYAMLFTVLDLLLDAGVGAVVESNFSHGRSETDLLKRIKCASSVQLHCETGHDEIRRRYRQRALDGSRHPGHHDTSPETLADLEASLASNRHLPLDLPIPLLRIDTTNGYDPGLNTISAFIDAAVGR
jgi:predicted kinase